MNGLHENIKFTTDREDDAGSVPFLDIRITRHSDQSYTTELFVKPTHSGITLHYDSAHPKRTKENTLENELRRAVRLSSFFPKCWSYSVERVDEGGWPQQSKVFFLKIALLANASPSKLIRLPAGTSASRLQVLFQISLYPHWLNIGWRLFNDWLRISRYQISAHFTR